MQHIAVPQACASHAPRPCVCVDLYLSTVHASVHPCIRALMTLINLYWFHDADASLEAGNPQNVANGGGSTVYTQCLHSIF
jgi:hypothetical protein